MQKLDYTEKISQIIKVLRTTFFVEFYNKHLASPTTPINFSPLIPALFDTKSQYEVIKFDKDVSIILEALGASKIFSSENLTWLTTVFNGSKVSLNHVLSNKQTIDFFLFHKTLFAVNLLNSELFKFPENKLVDSKEGSTILRLLENDNYIPIEKLSKIFKLIEELVDVLSKIFDEKIQPKIYLLDSGSDTNIGLETGAKVAKSLYLIFKEVWDKIVNHQHYKNQKDYEALLESLTVRKAIADKRKKGIITEQEEKEYVHLVKTRTESLIGLNVITKEIYDSEPSKKVVTLTLEAYNSKLLNIKNSSPNPKE